MIKKLWGNILQASRVLYFRVQSDLCFLRASSLSFQSVLSIVPVLAVMFGIAKGFGVEGNLENILRSEFKDQQEVITYFIQFGHTLLVETQGGIIAGIGSIVLLFTVMKLLSNIEDSLNTMWGIKYGRPLSRKASDYLALILVCPILLVVSSSITVFVTSNLQRLSAAEAVGGQVGPLIALGIPLIAYLVSMALFTLVYIVMPYTKVKIGSALLAGFFAGFAYQVLQATYISTQLKISNAGAIYGSFAALPLFLMWLYLSWLIFLVGAEIVVIHQEQLWDPELVALSRNLSPCEVQLASLACVKAAVDAFSRSEPLYIKNLALLLKMPERICIELAQDLFQANLLLRTSIQEGEETAIIPAKSPENFRVLDVLVALEGKNNLTSDAIKQFEQLMQHIKEYLSSHELNTLLKDLVPNAANTSNK
ncbi:MAG: YihY/virulence factor BrkB family protein [Verrucomicrobia bacterium]|nr:YihY/virulence factor BrkB family protein [Verrucomicrobiota bacterium]